MFLITPYFLAKLTHIYKKGGSGGEKLALWHGIRKIICNFVANMRSFELYAEQSSRYYIIF